jgi:hypothetical protein
MFFLWAADNGLEVLQARPHIELYRSAMEGRGLAASPARPKCLPWRGTAEESPKPGSFIYRLSDSPSFSLGGG